MNARAAWRAWITTRLGGREPHQPCRAADRRDFPPMKLSVVIPFWNSEQWLATSIESALAQDAAAEIIAVDDGSTDGSAGVAERYGDRVRLIRQNNAGVSVARNTGLAAAIGDYVVFLDADDYFEGPVLRGVAAVATAAAGAHDIIFSRSSWAMPSGRGGVHVFRQRWPHLSQMEIAADVVSCRIVPVHAQAFRRQFLLDIGGNVPGIVSSQDMEILCRSLLLGAKTGFNEEGQAIYFRRPSHSGLSMSTSFPTLESDVSWLRDHLRTLPVASSPSLLDAYAQRAYKIAILSFENLYRPLGREALALAREAGLRGHPGARTHRTAARILGLERKVAVAQAVRTIRRAMGASKKPTRGSRG